jgi:hypothetical protein
MVDLRGHGHRRSVYTMGNTGSVMLSYLQNTISWQLEIMMSQWKTSSYKEVDLVLTLPVYI